MREISCLSMIFPVVNSLKSRSSYLMGSLTCFMGSLTCSDPKYSCGHNCKKTVLLSLSTWHIRYFSPCLPDGFPKSSSSYLAPTSSRNSRSLRNGYCDGIGICTLGISSGEAACLKTDLLSSARHEQRRSSLCFCVSKISHALCLFASSASFDVLVLVPPPTVHQALTLFRGHLPQRSPLHDEEAPPMHF